MPDRNSALSDLIPTQGASAHVLPYIPGGPCPLRSDSGRGRVGSLSGPFMVTEYQPGTSVAKVEHTKRRLADTARRLVR